MKKLIKKLTRKPEPPLETKEQQERRWLYEGVEFHRVNNQLSFLNNTTSATGYFLPYQNLEESDYRQLYILKHGFHEFLIEKYTDQNFQIRPTDTVIDCGAFVGGFSVAARLRGAKRVISVEPSSKNFRCLKLNLSLHTDENPEALNIGLGAKPETAKLNLSLSGCDDSILAPDEGALDSSEEIQIETVANIVGRLGITPSDLFLKVEAEGYEPEIIDGLGDVRPRIVVVDVTPERDGESPRELIQSKLERLGYSNFLQTKRCLFASWSS